MKKDGNAGDGFFGEGGCLLTEAMDLPPHILRILKRLLFITPSLIHSAKEKGICVCIGSIWFSSTGNLDQHEDRRQETKAERQR
jgi:hypothetical protein